MSAAERAPSSCRASFTFSYAVNESNRLCIWKMKPMPRRTRTNSPDESDPRSWPNTSIRPCCMERSAPISVSIVVFPEPEGPVITTSCPGEMSIRLPNST